MEEKGTMAEPWRIEQDFQAGELTPWQELSRGLKTVEGQVAGHQRFLDDLHAGLELAHDALNKLNHRDRQLTATIEGVDTHLETLEASQQTYDTSIANLQQSRDALYIHLEELHSTFQASIDALTAKFDEYMQMVRQTSYNMIAQGTRITQLETLTSQQRTMIETALRGLKEIRETFPEKFS